MSYGLPALNSRAVIAALTKAGFEIVRSKGSHRVLQHSRDPTRRVVIPVHGSKDLKPGTLRAIIAQAGFSVAEFKALL